MNTRRLLAIIMFICIAAVIPGCKPKYLNTYFFSFKEEQDLTNIQGEWIEENGPSHVFTANGITVENVNLACPLRFSGDMAITIKFWLNVDEDHPYRMCFGISDNTWWCGHDANDIHIDFYSVGADSESYYISDHDDDDDFDYEHYDIDDLVPNLRRKNVNTLLIVKTGDNVVLRMNGTKFADFNLAEYDSQWFGPNFYAYATETEDFDYGATYESIKVEYNGTTSPMPLP